MGKAIDRTKIRPVSLSAQGIEKTVSKIIDQTTAFSEDGKTWEGYGTGLKPAHEVWWLLRKPFPRSVASNVQEFGTGALNIDGSRVATEKGYEASTSLGVSSSAEGWDRPWKHDPAARAARAVRSAESQQKTVDMGRWPPNFFLSHSPACVGQEDQDVRCVEGCPVKALNAESPEAARFFPCFRYEAKPSRTEREAGLREAGLREAFAPMTGSGIGVREHDPSESRAFVRNTHPTVKPIELMKWLITLVTPKGGVVLDPFLGSGTTALAAQRLRFSCIGIEREPEYVQIAVARLRGDGKLLPPPIVKRFKKKRRKQVTIV